MKYLGKTSVVLQDDGLQDAAAAGADLADEDEDDSSGDTSIDEEEVDSSNSGPSLDSEADEQEQLSFPGVVASLGAEALTLEDGTSFALNDETRVDGAPSVGAAVRVDAVRLSDGTLIATRVDDESDYGDEVITSEG